MIYDCMIIGKGLIGSAAAKYLSGTHQNVAIIGADEPADLSEATVYASHYDQARVQRIIGTDAVSTLLNKQSADAYKKIESESNISFHGQPGCLYVNPHGNDDYLDNATDLSGKFHTKFTKYAGDDLKAAFPYYVFPSAAKAILEPAPAGFINPRALIQAQLFLHKKNKGDAFTGVATDVRYTKDYFEIVTESNERFKAKKVLLCTGAFVNALNLTEKKLAVTVKSETILLAKVSKEEALRLSQLPSLLYEIDLPEYKNIYLIQPVLYPDGCYYLKMGSNLAADNYFNNLTDIQHWFRKGNSNESLTVLTNALRQIMPGIKATEFSTRRCIVSYTTHGKPYIGALNNKGLYVAAIGNGYSAMCSDALGSIAAHVVAHDVFPETYAAAAFQPVFA